jgi:hypothetical protein
MNVQIARGSGVATITLSEAEVRRFLGERPPKSLQAFSAERAKGLGRVVPPYLAALVIQ